MSSEPADPRASRPLDTREGSVIRLVVLGVLGVAGLIATTWERHSADEQREAVAAVVGSRFSAPPIRSLYAEHASLPEASDDPPLVAEPLRSAPPWWSAHASDRPVGSAPTEPDARGVVVSVDGAWALDPLTGWLPAERVPDAQHHEIDWVAFARRRWIDVPSGVAVERIDLRVVRVQDGAPIGRVTAEAKPDQRPEDTRLPVEPATAAAELVQLLEDPATSTAAPPTAFPAECFAETLPTLAAPGAEATHPSCREGSTLRCRSECEHGSSGACVTCARADAYDPSRNASEAARRACELGAAAGCRLYARAWLRWSSTDPVGSACATELLRRACAAGDVDACER